MKLASVRPTLEQDWGIHLAQDAEFLPREYKNNFNLALDAQPTLVSTANSGIPGWLAAYVDPEVIRIVQTPNKGAEILGEAKIGDWTTETATFNIVENTGEVAPYGDWNNNGRSDANNDYVNRASYLFQTVVMYGDLQVDRAGLARLNWVSEVQTSAAMTLDKFMDYSYHFGIVGMACYGMLNEPNLPAALTPSTKAAGGTKWVNNGVIVATANEIFNDLQYMVMDLVTRTASRVQKTDTFKLVMPPQSDVALMQTNQFGINVMDLLQKNFPTDRRDRPTPCHGVRQRRPALGRALQWHAGRNERLQREAARSPDRPAALGLRAEEDQRHLRVRGQGAHRHVADAGGLRCPALSRSRAHSRTGSGCSFSRKSPSQPRRRRTPRARRRLTGTWASLYSSTARPEPRSEACHEWRSCSHCWRLRTDVRRQ